MAMCVIKTPLAVAPLAGLVGVAEQRRFLCNEDGVCCGGGSCAGVLVVHKLAAGRDARPWVRLSRDTVVPQAASLLPGQRDAARVQESPQLTITGRRLADCAQHLACAAAETAVGEMLAMTKASKVADNYGLHLDVEAAHVVTNAGDVGDAQSKKPAEKHDVFALEKPSNAVFVIVDHAEAEDPRTLCGLRRKGVVEDHRGELELASFRGISRDNDRDWLLECDELGKGRHRLLARVVVE
eukprot:3950030-Pleurochrysis_carterae.AAC.4